MYDNDYSVEIDGFSKVKAYRAGDHTIINSDIFFRSIPRQVLRVNAVYDVNSLVNLGTKTQKIPKKISK